MDPAANQREQIDLAREITVAADSGDPRDEQL